MLVNDLAESVSLDGIWSLALGQGAPSREVVVPGSWEAQGYPLTVEGPALYRREVAIPASWAGRSIRAEFDAISYACTIRLNGVEVGGHRGLWTPFAVDLSATAQPGEENLLEIEVYKPGRRYAMRGALAGFLPDVATTFGGIWQSARLRALEVAIEDLRVDADPEARTLRVHGRGWMPQGAGQGVEWLVEVRCGQEQVALARVPLPADKRLDVTLPVPGATLWSPEQPALYTVQVGLLAAGEAIACASQRTGFRGLSAEGDQLLLNGAPFMVRGILSWGWEPDRIAPAYTPAEARAEMHRVRSLGFNTIKLCLFVPNQAYYDVADEEGMVLWQEWPMWLPEVTPELRALAPLEYADLTRLTRDHPSVCLYSLGCELNSTVDAELLSRLDQAVRTQVFGALVCDNSGSGESYQGLDLDLADFNDYHPYCDLHYLEPLLDHWRRDWKTPRPWILGELGDSDTFRDTGEIVRAHGGRRPWWLTADNPVTAWRPESRAMLEAEGRLALAQPGFTTAELTRASLAQSLVIRKYILEALRRRRGIGGYVITGLRDTPISTSGLWDDLGRPKWSEAEFLPLNGDAVMSLDVGRRRRWRHGGDRPERQDPYNLWAGQPARWHVILSLTGREMPAGGEVKWALVDLAGVRVAGGSDTIGQAISPGVPREAYTVECVTPNMDRPAELRLEVTLTGGGLVVANQWPVWVYPPLAAPPAGLAIFDPGGLLEEWGDWLQPVQRVQPGDGLAPFRVILATTWDRALCEYVGGGGRALLLQQGSGPLPVRRCPFWREAVKLFPAHPVWEAFPQRGYADLQFLGLAGDVAFESSTVEQALPNLHGYRPILRRLDAREFHVTDYLFEAQLGRGVLLACALRLQGGAGAQPFGWQRNVAGAALLQALLEHLRRR